MSTSPTLKRTVTASGGRFERNIVAHCRRYDLDLPRGNANDTNVCVTPPFHTGSKTSAYK